GVAVAGRHVWLQHLPPEKRPACGPALDYLLSAFGPVEGLSRVLRGSGECGAVDWTLLSFSIPEWTLAAFVALAAWAGFLAGRDEGDMAGNAAAGERYAELGARGGCCGHSGDDFEIDSRSAQRIDFFLSAAEKQGVASLQPHHDTVLAGGVHQPLVDEALGRRVAAAALAHENFPGVHGERERLRVHERIVIYQLGALENFRRAQ